MRLFSIFKISIRSILANKARSILTMLGVIIGVASVILLVSIGSGIKSYISERFNELGSNLVIVLPGKIKFGSGDPSVYFVSSQLSTTEANNIKKYVKSVLDVSIESGAKKTVKYKKNNFLARIYITDNNFSKVINYKIERGSFFNRADVATSSKVAVIGHTIIDELFKGEDPLGKYIYIDNSKFKVIGIYQKKGGFVQEDMDAMVIIPYTTAKREFGIEKITSINVKIKGGVDINLAKRKIKKVLLKTLNRDDFTLLTQEELLNSIQGILSTITLALAGIAAISLIVGGVGIMNIMLVSVTERTKEIGLRKAVGATFSDILVQFVVEAIILSSLGGIAGIILGIAGSQVLNKFFTTHVTLWSTLLAFAFSVFVGIIFGTYPAYKAARKDPIEALRFE